MRSFLTAFHRPTFVFKVCQLFVVLLTNLQAQGQVGGIDLSFDPGLGANDNVWTVATQPDGKAVIGGRFTSVNGVARNRIARLNPDGSVDSTFNPGTGANGEVQIVRLDANGGILVGGGFSVFNGTNRAGIARLNPNGSLDLGFNPGTGANGTVWAIGVQADGRVLIGGEFSTVNNVGYNRIARLTTTGAPDETFVPGTGITNGTVYALAIQANGRILLGGGFSAFAGAARTNIARLTSNGSLDVTFNSGAGAGSTGNSVNALGLQSDGKIIVGGDFDTFDGAARSFVARVDTNGAVDLSFNADPNLTVRAISVQSDNRIVIGGDFDRVSTVPRQRIARLLSHGGLDTSFDTSAASEDTVECLALQSDGRVVLGGWFSIVNGVPRNRIARLHVTPSALSPMLAGTRSGNNFDVAFASLTNTAYLLEYNDSLSSPAWIPLGMVFGNGLNQVLTDVNPGVPRRFYRLRTLYSQPYLLNPRRVGNTFSVSVPAFAWRTMILEYKNSLNDPMWTSLPGVAGDNTIKVLTDPTATVPTRIYRVRAQ